MYRLASTLFFSLALIPFLTRATAAEPSEHLWDDQTGARAELAARGLTFDLFHTFDLYHNVSGGDTERTGYFGRQRFSVDLDLNKWSGWSGASFHATGVAQYGRNVASDDIQINTAISSIEGREITRLGQIYFEQKLIDERLTVRLGKIDGIGEFGLQELGSSFINLELNYAPVVHFSSGMPYDPAGKPAAVVAWALTDLVSIKAGVFAGNGNDAYAGDQSGFSFAVRGPTIMAGEISAHTRNARSRVKLGFHHNVGTSYELVDSTRAHDGKTLVYLQGSTTLVNLDSAGARHWEAGLSLAGTEGDLQAQYRTVTAQTRIIGPFASRPRDEVGLGYIYAAYSGDASAASEMAGGPSLSAEQTIELSYKVWITPWFMLQPDLQLVFDPRGDGNRSTAVVPAIRGRVVF